MSGSNDIAEKMLKVMADPTEIMSSFAFKSIIVT